MLSLLAYHEPEKSPSGEMLGSKFREDLAASLNGAILRSKGRTQESALEQLLQHGVSLPSCVACIGAACRMNPPKGWMDCSRVHPVCLQSCLQKELEQKGDPASALISFGTDSSLRPVT